MIINEKYFKQYSPVPLNYNMAEIKNYINVAEKIWVRPLIGDDLYYELEDQVKNNNVSDINATLLTEGGLWQYLSFATVFEGLPFIWAHISEVGLTKGKSDNSDSLDLKDLTLVQQHLRNQTEVLKDQLKKWLCERSDIFTIDCCACGCDCCGNTKARLNKPNPLKMVYGTPRKNTNLK